MKHLFLVSQPRSGSTMLQAVLSNHMAIATRSEPWLQLLQAPFLNPDLMRAPFDWKITVDAVNEVEAEGRCLKNVQSALRTTIDQYYEASTEQSADYFLDKTPRYYYILEELYTQYPDAQFLVLYRNPVSVLASIHKTWLSEKRFESLYDYAGDLIDAPRLMDAFVTKHGADERVMTVKYEQLVTTPSSAFTSIFEWLGLEYSDALLSYGGNTAYTGKYGDPSGVQQGRVEARIPKLQKQFSEVFPNKRLANLASGLAVFYQREGYIYSGGEEWEPARKTREFERFLREHQMRGRKTIPTRACIRLLMDRLLVRFGL
jgi:hypothetical protein